MVCYFAGGAAGSVVAASIYDSLGWAGVCAVGGAIGLLITAVALSAGVRRGAGVPVHPVATSS